MQVRLQHVNRYYFSMRYFIIFLLFPYFLSAQTFGPKNPTSGTNVVGIGTNAWVNAGNILSSNNARATQAVRGATNYLQGTGFGFNLLSTDIVSGIQLDVEKSSSNVSDVTLLGSWSVGTTRSLPAGNNRCLVVIIGSENATERDVIAVTYGGINLIQLSDIGIATPFYGRIEAWYLLESELALATNTTISYTYGASVLSEEFDILSAGVYANVDQIAPFNDVKTTAIQGGSTSCQFTSPVNTLVGSMTVTGIFCGNPPSPAQAKGNSTAFTINTGFTEMVDYHVANPGFSSSGGVLEVAQKSATAIGTVNPTFTFSGTPNRRLIIGVSLRRARQIDNSVRLKKASGYVGTDKMMSGVEWPTTDTYFTYGGAGDLWGTTWNETEINNASFGAGLSAIVQNGTANVDHMRITIYTTSILPLELIHFGASQQDQTIVCDWLTASERNTQSFIVERSTDGFNFEAIGSVIAAGNSESVLSYHFTDNNPIAGINYYRLLMVDLDGGSEYADIISENFQPNLAIQLYPNPANQWTTVLTPAGFDEIIITNAQGQIIDRIAGTSLQQQQLALNSMPDGMYYLTIKSATGKVVINQLVKTSRIVN